MLMQLNFFLLNKPVSIYLLYIYFFLYFQLCIWKEDIDKHNKSFITPLTLLNICYMIINLVQSHNLPWTRVTLSAFIFGSWTSKVFSCWWEAVPWNTCTAYCSVYMIVSVWLCVTIFIELSINFVNQTFAVICPLSVISNLQTV